MTPLKTERGHILFDQEEPAGRSTMYFFQDPRKKQFGTETNLVGSGGSMPLGQMFDAKAVRVSGIPNGKKLNEHVRLVIRFSGADEGPPPFDRILKPGELVEFGKTIRLWPLEYFCAEILTPVFAPVRLEIHGDLHRYTHSNRVSPGGDRLFMLREDEIRALTSVVERAIPSTRDKVERATLSFLLGSLKENAWLLNGSFHLAQVLRGEVTIVSFMTPDAAEAHQKAFANVAAGLGLGSEAKVWRLPDEIGCPVDPEIRDKVMAAWDKVMGPLQDDLVGMV